MKTNHILLILILVLLVCCGGASASYPYWIDANINTYVPVTIPSGQSITLYVTTQAGYAPDGNSVFPEFFDDFDKYMTQYNGSVTQKANLAVASADVPVVVYDYKLYLFGGYGATSGVNLNTTQRYDPTTDSWTILANMLTACWGPAAVLHGNFVYVFGGSNASGGTNFVNKTQIYDIANNTWSYGPDMPDGLGHQGLMAATNYTDAFIYYDQLFYRYNYVSQTYTQLANGRVSTDWGELVYVPTENSIYEIGGTYALGSAGSNPVYKYYINNNSWSNIITRTPYFAFGHTRENTLWRDRIYYGFGQDPAGTFHDQLFYFNLTTQSWSNQVGRGMHPRDGVGASIIGNTLYVVGGRDTTSGTHGLLYNEAFDLTNETANPTNQTWDSRNWANIPTFKSGVYTVSDGKIDITAQNGSKIYWLLGQKGADTNRTLIFRSNITPTSASQISQIGWCNGVDLGNKNSMDYYSNAGFTEIEAGNGNTYDVHQVPTYFGNMSNYEIQRRPTSTNYSVNGSLIYSSSTVGSGIWYPSMDVRNTNQNHIVTEYMAIKQYTPIEPTINILNSNGNYYVTVSNTGSQNLSGYQLKIPGASIGIVSRSDSLKISDPVDFSSNVSGGVAPLTVQFTDLSQNSTSWTWDFNNDSITDSTAQNLVYTYPTPGIYTVNLTVTNEFGVLSTLKQNYINVSQGIPIVDFTEYPTSGDTPLNVNFTDETLGGGPYAYNWNFGDGRNSSIQNTTHIYNTAGVYTVNLTVTNAVGTSSTRKQVTVNAQVQPSQEDKTKSGIVSTWGTMVALSSIIILILLFYTFSSMLSGKMGMEDATLLIITVGIIILIIAMISYILYILLQG